VDTASCLNSEVVLKQLGATYASRTNNQNLFATMLGFAKMGTYLHSKFDNESSGSGNGTVDVGWDSCTAGAATLKLSDAEVTQVILGLGMLFENLAALTAALSGSNGGLDSINTAKTACEAAMGGAGNCTITDPTAVTAQMIRTFRRMIGSSEFGFAGCSIAAVNCCMGLPFP
jgi:hypothetical protein